MRQSPGHTRRASAPARGAIRAGDVVALLVLLAVGTVVPLVNGAEAVAVLVTLVAGLVAGSATVLVPGRARFLVLFGVLLGGLVLGGLLGLLDGLTFLTWFAAVFVGGFAGSLLAVLAARPEASQDRSTRHPVAPGQGLRALWDEGEERVETTDPGEAQLLAAVRALDGAGRTFVSIFRGSARLDVAGDARGAVMVFQCDDRTGRRAAWHHLVEPDQPGAEEPVVVAVGRVPGNFRRAQTTSVSDALRAVEHFVATSGRVPELSWHGDRDVVDMRAPLQPTD